MEIAERAPFALLTLLLFKSPEVLTLRTLALLLLLKLLGDASQTKAPEETSPL